MQATVTFQGIHHSPVSTPDSSQAHTKISSEGLIPPMQLIILDSLLAILTHACMLTNEHM